MGTSNLLHEGVILMIFGVGFVFAFLTLLVIATSLMSWIIIRYENSVGALPKDGVSAPTAFISPHEYQHDKANHAHSSDSSLISILSVAVYKYRLRHKNKHIS